MFSRSSRTLLPRFTSSHCESSMLFYPHFKCVVSRQMHLAPPVKTSRSSESLANGCHLLKLTLNQKRKLEAGCKTGTLKTSPEREGDKSIPTHRHARTNTRTQAYAICLGRCQKTIKRLVRSA
uniref:Uncharacterized protein n=1 Tax=Rhipicephalus zambeziensis TaxID=60191 RepID=A0A224YHC5_9ACAR